MILRLILIIVSVSLIYAVRGNDNIKEESNRMNNLVLKLLDLSKTEDLKDNVIYSKVNLSKIINNKAMSLRRHVIATRNIKIVCKK